MAYFHSQISRLRLTGNIEDQLETKHASTPDVTPEMQGHHRSGNAMKAIGQTEAPVQRKEQDTEPVEMGSQKKWYMLQPPPITKQVGPTCWAAGISSLLRVKGISNKTDDEILASYPVSSTCIDDDDLSLPSDTSTEVFKEWWIDFNPNNPVDLTPAGVRRRLQSHGHFMAITNGASYSHVRVIYGMGFDSDGEPNENYVSVMDPIDGKYKNIPLSFLNPMRIGTVGKRAYPAACRKKE